MGRVRLRPRGRRPPAGARRPDRLLPRSAVGVSEWWRDAVFYEIYVRSFADSDGDGLGDLPGIRARLPYLRELGVDAIWLTPFYPSPDFDHGYDVADFLAVDPRFGTLTDFDALVADAHALGIRVVVDIVPNHTSITHEWFRNALADPRHPDRARYVFRPGRGGGPPNNWPSNFGGPAWTLDERSGEWYLHLFAPEQPDLDWHNPAVRSDFERILRFWLDRGVDGLRIDVAHGLFKDPELRDEAEPAPDGELFSSDRRAAIDRPELHPLYRRWRRLADGYEGDRVLIGEVMLTDPRRVADYVRPDELHLAFNFTLLFQPWERDALRDAIERTLSALGAVGASATWVLENHDVGRLPTRYGGGEQGRRRARAAALLLLALPGAAFLYAGQELGLETVELPPELRQDPVFVHTRGARVGRDGSRVPLPWQRELPAFGFTAGTPWLPVPETWASACVDAQVEDASSTLTLYRSAIAARRVSGALRRGWFAWVDSPPGTLVFERAAEDERVVCLVNVAGAPLGLPYGELMLVSEPDVREALGAGTAAWVRVVTRRRASR
ncbi:MAG: alpha-amylase [Thermoleophilia bacterium]|nr:alpha-amylase [Thermoleophilia bacterium]